MHIVIADDHVLVLDTLSQYLSRFGGEEWRVTTCDSLGAAIDAVTVDRPDLVLLDWRMPGMLGGDGLHHFKTRFPDIRVAIMSGLAEQIDRDKALELGAVGFLAKTMSGRDFAGAIQALLQDREFVSSQPTYRRDPQTNAFTPRENEVYHLAMEGLSNQEIADKLSVALVTVKLHMSNILRKTNTASRTKLLAQK